MNATSAQILDALGGKLPVITRSGCPCRLEDLRMAAVASASTVLLQYPEGLEQVRAGDQVASGLRNINGT